MNLTGNAKIAENINTLFSYIWDLLTTEKYESTLCDAANETGQLIWTIKNTARILVS